MSLDWNASKVKDWSLLHNTAPKGQEPPFPKGSPEDLEGDRQWVISESLIFRLMAVDMGSITEKNIDEFFVRNSIVSDIIGKPFRMDGKDADFTYADVHRRIGLSCNVITRTRPQFKKRWWDYLEREATSSLRYQKQKFEQAKSDDGSLAGSGVGSVSTQPREGEAGYTDAEDILALLMFFVIVGGLVGLLLSGLFATDTHSTTYAIDTKKNLATQTEWHEQCHFTLSFDKCDPHEAKSTVSFEYSMKGGKPNGVPTEIIGIVDRLEAEQPRGLYSADDLMDED